MIGPMRRRHYTALLWIALVVCAPLPFFLVETGNQPIAVTLQMLLFIFAIIANEGTGGQITLAAWILGLQILLGFVAFGMLSLVITRALERALGRRAAAVTCALIVVMFTVALTRPIYRTPFRATGLNATLSEAFE
jgi:hypothetical protein